MTVGVTSAALGPPCRGRRAAVSLAWLSGKALLRLVAHTAGDSLGRLCARRCPAVADGQALLRPVTRGADRFTRPTARKAGGIYAGGAGLQCCPWRAGQDGSRTRLRALRHPAGICAPWPMRPGGPRGSPCTRGVPLRRMAAAPPFACPAGSALPHRQRRGLCPDTPGPDGTASAGPDAVRGLCAACAGRFSLLRPERRGNVRPEIPPCRGDSGAA